MQAEPFNFNIAVDQTNINNIIVNKITTVGTWPSASEES